ncbi:MAG: hypothetical protein EA418_12570 [Wenzhouxiangellaceae bacterium]|nr:MAG: hypothetical protein EA418_12570 [Wenzhouxiangellaceae bacterium]
MKSPLSPLLAFALLFIACGEQPRAMASEPALFYQLSPPFMDASPSDLTVAGDYLFFLAHDGSATWLWRTDGTVEGTIKLTPSPRVEIVQLGNIILFSRSDNDTGAELWRSDGTPEGTTMVKDIRPGQSGSFPRYFFVFQDRVFFVANDGEHGEELWASDGTEQGTMLVKDTRPGGSGMQAPLNVAVLNNKFFFTNTPAQGDWKNLWVSDGTTAGTTTFTDPEENSGPFAAQILIGFSNQILIQGQRELNAYRSDYWRSDGTSFGTVRITDTYEDWVPVGYSAGLGNNTLLGETAIIRYYPGAISFVRKPLWTVDWPDSDIRPSGPLVSLGDKVYFSARNISNFDGFQLWRTDGTVLGTLEVAVVDPTGSFGPSDIEAIDGSLYFSAPDADVNRQLWISDGTTSGTRLHTIINPTGHASPGGFTLFKDRIYFSADDGQRGRQLWSMAPIDTNTIFTDAFEQSN